MDAPTWNTGSPRTRSCDECGALWHGPIPSATEYLFWFCPPCERELVPYGESVWLQYPAPGIYPVDDTQDSHVRLVDA